MFKRKKKLPLNRDYLARLRQIVRCKDQDIMEHRMLRDSMFSSVSIDKGWTCYATITMSDGKRFRARWYALGLEELRAAYMEAIRYGFGRKSNDSKVQEKL